MSILIPNQRSGKIKIINIVKGNCRITIALPLKNLKEEIIRKIAKRILQNRYGFNEDQVNTLFSTQKNKNKIINIMTANKPPKRLKKETIEEIVHRLLQDKLSIRDIRAEAYALALLISDVNAGLSYLSRLYRKLRNLNASSEIIEAIKFPNITEEANKI